MKILLKKPQDIAIQGKSFPNVAGEPFEADERVTTLLDQVGVEYKIVEEDSKKKKVPVDPTVSQGESAGSVEVPNAETTEAMEELEGGGGEIVPDPEKFLNENEEEPIVAPKPKTPKAKAKPKKVAKKDGKKAGTK